MNFFQHHLNILETLLLDKERIGKTAFCVNGRMTAGGGMECYFSSPQCAYLQAWPRTQQTLFYLDLYLNSDYPKIIQTWSDKTVFLNFQFQTSTFAMEGWFQDPLPRMKPDRQSWVKGDWAWKKYPCLSLRWRCFSVSAGSLMCMQSARILKSCVRTIHAMDGMAHAGIGGRWVVCPATGIKLCRYVIIIRVLSVWSSGFSFTRR